MPEVTEKLQDSIDETAKIARTSLLFFLVVALYLLIIVGTTTDLMLLRDEIVALPLMEVGVPVVTFYIVAPPIFLLLHSNLLFRLSQLAKTIKQWEANSNSKGQEDDHDSLVFPVDFARLLLDGKPRWTLYGGFYSIIVLLPVVTQIVLLPIVVLLVLQMSFLAYQNSFITLWHQLIVTADLVLLFLFVCFVRGTRGEKEVDFNYVLKMLFQMRGKVFSAVLVLIFTWAIAVVPNSWQETLGMNADDFYSAVDDLQERSIQQQLSACLRQLSACVFADWWEGYSITSFRPARRFLNVAEQPIALKEIPPEIVSELIIKEEAKLKGEETELKVEEAKPDPLCEYIGELDLSERKLNYARFYGSQFRCVKLESAELHGADLQLTKLHYANLSKAKLHGAKLRLTELHYANLSKAELHGADLFGAELYGADLFEAELYGANLWFAELHGANLFKANLHGAYLSNAKLYGAYLSEAKLHGADLFGAKLYDANLSKAELHGADLSKAELHGADLGDVMLKNTDLSDVRWDKLEDDQNNIMSNIDKGNKIRINSIRVILKKRGLSGDEIKKVLSQVVEEKLSKISSMKFSFVPPPTPIATACVVHSGQGPFTKWPIPAEGCDIKLASSLADLACQNQWTAKGIVNRVTNEKSIDDLAKALGINSLINKEKMAKFIKPLGIVIRARPIKKDINLITALLKEDCSSLNPYREELSDALKKLNQQRIPE